MNNLDKLRDEKARERGQDYMSTIFERVDLHEGDIEAGFESGWDAHEALNLPVLFMEYSANLISTRKDGHILHLLPEVSKQDRWYTEQELYGYWVKNILKF